MDMCRLRQGERKSTCWSDSWRTFRLHDPGEPESSMMQEWPLGAWKLDKIKAEIDPSSGLDMTVVVFM